MIALLIYAADGRIIGDGGIPGDGRIPGENPETDDGSDRIGAISAKPKTAVAARAA